jgi:fatty acid desaturase
LSRRTSYVRQNGSAPSALNVVLGCVYTALNLYQFYLLPIFLLPRGGSWGWSLVLLVLLTNPFWSLIHEAIHDLFHPRRMINGFFGRLLAIVFGAPFRIVRMSHLLHHKLNRLPIEGTEYYDREKASRSGAAPGYYFQIFVGLYLVEMLSPLYFLLPRRCLQWIKTRYVRPNSVSALLMDNWLRPEALREIRFDGFLTLLFLGLAFFCYGEMWWLLGLALLGRGFLISFLDNIYHYETPVSGVFFAKNLRLPRPLAKLLLNFNLHGIHHINPAIPWIHLPSAFAIQAGQFQGGYFTAALRQLHGPRAIQDLPHARRNA